MALKIRKIFVVFFFCPVQNCRVKFSEKEIEFRLLKKERELQLHGTHLAKSFIMEYSRSQTLIMEVHVTEN